MVRAERIVDAVCADDARRFPHAAKALSAVAEHARAVGPCWRDVAAVRGVPNIERALREPAGNTLKLLREGLVVVEELCAVANAEGDVGLFSFCGSWLRRRRPLVDTVAAALGAESPSAHCH